MNHLQRIALILLLHVVLMGCNTSQKAGAFNEGRKPTFNRLYKATWHSDHARGRASNIDLSNEVTTFKD